MYFFVYTPSNQHFKAFLVSKSNSETSFLYQLFKEKSNFIVTEPCKVICKSIIYDFHYYLYLFIYLLMYFYRYAVGYGVVTYPKIFQCWRRSSRCTCTIAQFRCSKLPLKFLHARTCRILSVFGYRVLDTWFEGKRVFGIKTHACVQK